MADAIPTRRAMSRRMVRSLPAVQLIGLVMVSVVALYGGLDALRTTAPAVPAPDAASLDANVERTVAIACAAPVVDTHMMVGEDGGADDDNLDLLLCRFGPKWLVVMASSPQAPQQLVGRLHAVTRDDEWPRALAAQYVGSPTYATVYLDTTGGGVDRALYAMVALLAGGALVGWTLFIRRAVRARRRQAA